MRIVAYAPYPAEGPSTRFRLAQLVEPLAEHGIALELVPFFTSREYAALYRAGGGLSKAATLVRALRRRWNDVRDVGARADAILVHREIAPILDTGLVRGLRRAGKPVVFDFDDAVFLPPRGGNRALGTLRRPGRATARLSRLADVVWAGNEYLASFARRARAGETGGVQVLPTLIDTETYRPPEPRGDRDATLTFGWIGTHTTLPYLNRLFPLLRELQERVPVRVLVVSNRAPEAFSGLEVEFRPWRADREVEYVQSMDIGLYPLPDDEWTRGKCGFKAIQYMACGVPVVASPVGVLKEILLHGEVGLLPTNGGEWQEALEKLVGRPSLRVEMSAKGRERVVREYSVGRWAPRIASRLRGIVRAGAP